jgi:uncharacterized protein
MRLVNEFVVPRGIDETWAVLTDVRRIAPAMPGAQLTEVIDDQYHGAVKIKVGPVTAAYRGVAKFRELDPANHHMVLDASGKESTGRGRAAAVVTVDLVPEGSNTQVKVTTDLTISGALAQFGRGAIGEVSSRLLNQFVEQLKTTVLAGDHSGPAPPADDHPGPASPADAGTPQAVSTTTEAEAPPTADTEPEPSIVDTATAIPTPLIGAAPAAEVNLLRVAGWPVLKRLLPVAVVAAVIVVLLIWWLG